MDKALAFFKQFEYSKFNPLQFNSVFFFALFSVFYLVYAGVFNKVKTRNTVLLLFSLFIYYKLSGLYVLLMMAVAASDFLIGKQILKTHSEGKKKAWLLLSLVVSLGSLLYFKYSPFILENVDVLLGTKLTPPQGSFLMPIGISFYIFKTISYVIDCYNEMIDEPEESYINYLLYVSLFTTIIAGPIARARDILPRLQAKLTVTEEFIGKGFFLILIGAVKKYLIADFLWVNFIERVFISPTLFSGFDNLMAVLMGTIQFYYDFAGYTDMMLGISLLLGLELQGNFNRPFMAQNISDFWRRWHITLSSWLNEYVFMPMSFAWRGMKKTGIVMASLFTFVISGVWHGPKFTYILWGTLHGAAIAWDVASQNWRASLKKSINGNVYSVVSIVLTFAFISLTMVIFNVREVPVAWDMYEMMFVKMDWSIALQWFPIYYREFIVFALAALIHFLPLHLKDTMVQYFTQLYWPLKAVVGLVVILFIYQFYSSETQPFIYLQF
ncbi:MAG: MBOAT family protein [Bacteroidetes bacterium]|nr:MAG: MBOAT family protein [Bacteroidota bacterium]